MKKYLPILIALPVFIISLLFLRPEATQPILVAASDLPDGHLLVASDITLKQVPKSLVPQGAVSDPSRLINQTLGVFRGAGEVITPAHLGGESISLAPNERAIAIHVNDAAGLAGLLHPGDTVGVTAVMDQLEGSFAKTVASSLRVLYISPDFKALEGSSSTTGSPTTSSAFNGGFSTSFQYRRDTEGTVVLAVPVEAITVGYDFSSFGISSESRLVSLTDLLPALDQVDYVHLSLFLEPDTAEPFFTSGLFLPDLVITPQPTATATPCPGGACPSPTPTGTVSLP
jgi:pilus assembly protein CpaB